jgi:hypothetical protein
MPKVLPQVNQPFRLAVKTGFLLEEGGTDLSGLFQPGPGFAKTGESASHGFDGAPSTVE